MKRDERPLGKVIYLSDKDATPAGRRSGIVSRIVDAIVYFKARSNVVRKAIGLFPRWVTPNMVTLFRGLLIVPVMVLMGERAYVSALLVLAFAMLLDFVDGALAHLRNMRSETGAFLDPLADKVLVCGVLFAALPELPKWAIIPVVAVCTFAAVLTLVRIHRMARARNGRDPEGVRIAASSAGKMKLLTETVSMFLILIGLSLGSVVLLDVAVGTLCIAAVLGGGSLYSQLLR